MFSWLSNAWRVPELRRRVLFTALILAAYRLGSWIPTPGIDQNAIQQYFSGAGGGILTLLNLFSGSALSRFSLFALGIMPYVTASIILQLLTVVVPTLERLQKEGEAGYAKINQYTRYLTVGLAAAQATGYAYLFKKSNALNANTGRIVLIIVTLPPTVASFFPTTQVFINRHFQYGSVQYLSIEAFLIIIFTYFYTAVQFNPVDQADNLRKYGGYIPGIRPGAPTAQYLDRVLTRLTLPGSLYLASVAVLPSIFIKYGGFSQATSRALGGTSVLIVVGVALDTMRQMESQMMMRSYEGFLR